MNILHISRTMGQGGAEKVVFQLCDNCCKHQMFVASTGGYYVEALEKKEIIHTIIPDINKKNPLLMLKTLFILNSIIKKYNIDVIHSHHRMAAFYSKILSLFNKKIKRVYTAHNVFFDKIKLLRFSTSGSEIVAVGDGVKNNLIDVYKIDEKNIKTIYNSILVPKKVDKAKDVLFEKQKVYIGSIGRLSEQKGFDIFINAMKSIVQKNDNVMGIIIGDGELKDELINQVKNNGLDDKIIFLGYRTDVLNIIKALDFVVLSSRWEGFPLTPIEVFSQKKTIVASDISGNNEIVKNEYNGLLFEKDNSFELSKKIEQMLNSKLRGKLEENAYNDFLKKYSFEKFVKNYEKIYKSIK